jgi:hypothetical protein
MNSSELESKGVDTPDPFNPAALRLPQDFTASIGVKKVLTSIPCRKPHKQEFVLVRSINLFFISL